MVLFAVGIAVFSMSILTNLSGIILPLAKGSMNLSLSEAGVLPFVFFVAYAVMSIPAGCINEKCSARNMMLMAFCFTALANLLFLLIPSYGVFLLSLFVAGAGMSVVQVVINPLVRTVGGKEYFSFYLIFGQIIYGGGSILSPLLFSYLSSEIKSAEAPGVLLGLIKKIISTNSSWISIYWVCFASCLLVIFLLLIINFPKVQISNEDKIGGFNTLFELLKDIRVWFFFIGIFAYAGVEQGISNWMTKFLETYHGLNPEKTGAIVFSKFWLCMSVGGFLGAILIFFIDVRRLLGIFVIVAMFLLGFSLFGTTSVIVYTFPLSGLFLAIMYPCIFSLGLNTIVNHHGALSGILCTGICGAAVIAFFIGFLGDMIGLKGAMCIIFAALLYILFISFWVKPIIKNKKII